MPVINSGYVGITVDMVYFCTQIDDNHLLYKVKFLLQRRSSAVHAPYIAQVLYIIWKRLTSGVYYLVSYYTHRDLII